MCDDYNHAEFKRNKKRSSDKEHRADALAPEAEEGRGQLRKAAGSCKQAIDPQMSEWGNPTVVMRRYP
jgi:hypothetical protein